MRTIASIIAIPLATAAVAACSSAPVATAPPNAASLTLTSAGCSRSELDNLPVGNTVIAVTNASDSVGNFEMLRLDGSFEDLVAYVAEEQTRIASGQAPRGTPASATEVGRLLLDPGMAGDLEITLTAGGPYAVVCAQLSASEDAVLQIFAVGPYEASN